MERYITTGAKISVFITCHYFAMRKVGRVILWWRDKNEEEIHI